MVTADQLAERLRDAGHFVGQRGEAAIAAGHAALKLAKRIRKRVKAR